MSHTNQQTIDAYDKTVAKYIDTSPQEVSGTLKVWIDGLLSKVPTTAKILEIGSGSGKDADYFATRGYSMQCTDASQSFVEHLNSNGHPARQLNALTDDLGSGYDVVFADAVLLHFTKPELVTVVSKIKSSLVPNGYFGFSLKEGIGDEVTDRKLEHDRYFCYWTEKEITQVLSSAGFTDIEITVVDDYRGKARNDWLLITAKNGASE